MKIICTNTDEEKLKIINEVARELAILDWARDWSVIPSMVRDMKFHIRELNEEKRLLEQAAARSSK